MATLKHYKTWIVCGCFIIFIVLYSLPLPLCVLLLAAYLGSVYRPQLLEDNVARMSKLVRDRMQAMRMLATSIAVHAMNKGKDDDSKAMATDADSNASSLPESLKDLKLLDSPIHRQAAGLLISGEEITVLSKERISKLKGHAIETQTMKSEHHAQVKALNRESSILPQNTAKERQAVKDGRRENEDGQIHALNDEITMLRTNAVRERAALEAAVQVAKEGGSDGELTELLEEKATTASSRVQALTLHNNAVKEQGEWEQRVAILTAREAMHEEELTKPKKKAVADTRYLQGTHGSSIQALLDTIATSREKGAQEWAGWEEMAAASATERQKRAKDAYEILEDFRQSAEDEHNRESLSLSLSPPSPCLLTCQLL